MCTTTHPIIKINNIGPCLMFVTYFIPGKYTHKLFYPCTLNPVNYMIIGQRFIYKIAPTREMLLNGEFLPNNSAFPLVVFFYELSLVPAPMAPVLLG